MKSILCLCAVAVSLVLSTQLSLNSKCLGRLAEVPVGEGTSGRRGQERLDSLYWLVGKWRCVAREFTKEPKRPLGSHSEDHLEYFNVFFPYITEPHHLELREEPDRMITAEFLVREVRWVPEFRERLVTMVPSGRVAIGTGKIRIGIAPFEAHEFVYRRVGSLEYPQLELRSERSVIILQKINDSAGSLWDSKAVSPLRELPREELNAVGKRYRELVDVARAKGLLKE